MMQKTISNDPNENYCGMSRQKSGDIKWKTTTKYDKALKFMMNVYKDKQKPKRLFSSKRQVYLFWLT